MSNLRLPRSELHALVKESYAPKVRKRWYEPILDKLYSQKEEVSLTKAEVLTINRALFRGAKKKEHLKPTLTKIEEFLNN